MAKFQTLCIIYLSITLHMYSVFITRVYKKIIMMPKIGYLRREGLLLPGGSVSSFSKMRGEGLLLVSSEY